MNPHAAELNNAAAQFRKWAEGSGVYLPASVLALYAAAMHEAAHELMLLHWRNAGGPPPRVPQPVPPGVVDLSAERRRSAADPQKNEPFHLSRPRCVTE